VKRIKLARCGYRQLREQHTVKQLKDGEIGPYAERQGQNHSYSESWRTPDLTDGILKILA
jgi:hypothetical protein